MKDNTIRHDDGRTERVMPGGRGSGPEVEAIRKAARKLREQNAARDVVLAEQLKRIKK